jgi:transcription-repair coupling factor (superfamily II helicase)
MTEPLVSDEITSFSFDEGLEEVGKSINQFPCKINIQGLRESSRALFLVSLIQSISKPIVVLTPNHSTGEILIGDIKYFCRLKKVESNIRFFPSWGVLPYENISPSSEVMGERLSVLHQLYCNEISLLVLPVDAIMQCVIPRKELINQTFTLNVGESLDREFLETCLLDNGFVRIPLIENRSQFSARGDIIDVYPSDAINPFRIELFDNTIESIREFDVNTQISLRQINNLKILPVRELSPTQVQKERGLESITKYAEENDVNSYSLKELIDKIKHLDNFLGVEHLAPFFYSRRETIFDYFAKDSLVVLDEEVDVFSEVDNFSELIVEEHVSAFDRGDVVPSPELLYMTSDELKNQLIERKIIEINCLNMEPSESVINVQFDIKRNPSFFGKFEYLVEKIKELESVGDKVVVVAPTKGQVKRVQELSDEYGLNIDVDTGYLSNGFSCSDLRIMFVAEHEIFGRTSKHRYRRKSKSKSFQQGFKDLKPGNYLVHADYGIGQYNGIHELETVGGGGEFLNISYAGGEKLYIPMDGLASIQKYMGSGDIPPLLDKLGGISWKKKKNLIKESIREMAEDLLKLYASREITEGTSYSSNSIPMQELSDSFEFEETEDQLKAIDETMEDLESSKSMDRLVCGDVGYGKTEVAMRAAFKVVLDKKQVAVLVPTTILAQQHLTTFRNRFKNHAVNIKMINRFKSPREQKLILEKVRTGEVDIIIGTHRLLSKDIDFAQLGLIIIDEEQRFGVKHKDSLKKMRNKVDILTLTATPIPRTLHFSLMGVRDLSVIETPPIDRLSIKTFVRKFDENIIKESIKKELKRGGQVYFVHNKIKSINSIKEMIQKLVPEARIGVGHGQLPEHQLEEIMRKFIEGEIDVLLCTTIIESGLDIPSANTIIINRADQFGLAQLYQLRGRVGRYKHQAYAYMLTPGALAISSEARQRLNAIEELSELGAGFQLAARDMEIRGVGNMLGRNQSGHISSIGFDLYSKLIEETVRELKGEEVQSQFIEPEIDLRIKGYIPKSYIPDLNQRLEIYRRLQLIDTVEDCNSIESELMDRYGRPSENVEKLLLLVKIKTICRKLHIFKVYIKDNHAHFNVNSTTPITPEKISGKQDLEVIFVSEFCLGLKLKFKNWKKDILFINYWLNRILKLVTND